MTLRYKGKTYLDMIKRSAAENCIEYAVYFCILYRLIFANVSKKINNLVGILQIIKVFQDIQEKYRLRHLFLKDQE